MSVKRLVPLNAPVLSVLPSGNMRAGDLVFLSADNSLYVRDNVETWTKVGTGAGGENVGDVTTANFVSSFEGALF